MTDGAVPALRFVDVGVRFGGRVALHGIQLDVPPGQIVGLVGPNGSGKTTLLRVALGFVAPGAGRAELFGQRVDALRPVERARRVAWVPQDEAPRDDVQLLEYVLFGRYAHLRPLEVEGADDRRRAERALEEVGLADRAGEGILALSGGERQRALLARAMVQEAPLLLLDEPTSHLDIGHQVDLLDRVHRLSRERGVTIVAALHDLNLAARYADRIIALSRGRVVADGPPRDVISEELLIRVWGVVADLKRDPRTGTPYLLPHRLVARGPAGAIVGTGPVHVIAGGGAGSPYLRALTEAGCRVTTGALNLLDTDADTAESLGIPTAIEIPFAPLGAEVRTRVRELLAEARVIVVAPIAIGPSNLANLEELLPFVAGRQVFYARPPPGERADFTGGAADRLFEELRARGGIAVTGPEDLLARLGGEGRLRTVQ